MKARIWIPFIIFALAPCGFAATSTATNIATKPPAASATVTTVKRTTVQVGNFTLPLNQGSKLEVLGRQSDFLVVKFRSSQGKVPVRDTDFNPATNLVPELAIEPVEGKSSDLTISTSAHDSSTPSQGSIAASQKVAATNQSPKKEGRPVKAPNPSAPPPPVNN